MPLVQTNRSVKIDEVIDVQNRINPRIPVAPRPPEVRVVIGTVRSAKYVLDTSEDEIIRGLFCGCSRR
jgi:hypothetical protein